MPTYKQTGLLISLDKVASGTGKPPGLAGGGGGAEGGAGFPANGACGGCQSLGKLELVNSFQYFDGKLVTTVPGMVVNDMIMSIIIAIIMAIIMVIIMAIIIAISMVIIMVIMVIIMVTECQQYQGWLSRLLSHLVGHLRAQRGNPESLAN